ncbi:MAG: MgtC/SapB family protein, partial [Comamonadaceae bacterium]
MSLPVREAGAALAVALGCGLLIGVERERRKGTGPWRALAGVRSFALASLSGAAALLLGEWVMLLGAAFVAALGVVAYWRDRSSDPGVTTEIALVLTYLIGALCTQ